MRSSGFGLGKKQPQQNEAKKQPPSSNDLTNLLTLSQKTVDRSFFYKWQNPEGYMFNLTVVTHGMKNERRGWTVAAADSSSIQDAQWRLTKDVEGRSQELFNMQSSDAYLVQSVIDEIMAEGKPTEHISLEDPLPIAESSEPRSGPPAYGGAPVATSGSGMEEQRGNLRTTPMRVLMEQYLNSRASGHLIVDTGTVTSEVFFTDGEPVHAKSIHSIYKDKDMVGDNVVVDLMTWGDSDFKFRPGITSATRTVHSPARDLMQGKISAPPPNAAAAPITSPSSEFSSSPAARQSFNEGYSTGPAGGESSFNSGYSTGPGGGESSFNSGYATGPGGGESSFDSGYVGVGPGSGSAQLPGSAAPPIPLSSNSTRVNPEDFSNADDLIGETFSALIDDSGMLKYGMFLMLAKTEFARHELSKVPFCIAAIGLETADGGGLSVEAISKVQECFESAGQPLDTITAATKSRFFALFPHSSSSAAATSCKHFLNNIQTANLGSGLHGSALRLTIGLCDIPRDGHDFDTVMNYACKLRRAATVERRIVMGA